MYVIRPLSVTKTSFPCGVLLLLLLFWQLIAVIALYVERSSVCCVLLCHFDLGNGNEKLLLSILQKDPLSIALAFMPVQIISVEKESSHSVDR